MLPLLCVVFSLFDFFFALTVVCCSCNFLMIVHRRLGFSLCGLDAPLFHLINASIIFRRLFFLFLFRALCVYKNSMMLSLTPEYSHALTHIDTLTLWGRWIAFWIGLDGWNLRKIKRIDLNTELIVGWLQSHRIKREMLVYPFMTANRNDNKNYRSWPNITLAIVNIVQPLFLFLNCLHRILCLRKLLAFAKTIGFIYNI